MKIQVPAWIDCEERVEQFEFNDITATTLVMSGDKLTPLEYMVYCHQDNEPERAKKFRMDLKNLVEWCVNESDHVARNHEEIN